MPLSDASPVQSTDSAAFNMQHMAVVKDFRITYAMTNHVTVPRPFLVMGTPEVVRWIGISNLTYTVQGTTNFATWSLLGTSHSTTTNFVFTNQLSAAHHQFIRVVYP